MATKKKKEEETMPEIKSYKSWKEEQGQQFIERSAKDYEVAYVADKERENSWWGKTYDWITQEQEPKNDSWLKQTESDNFLLNALGTAGDIATNAAKGFVKGGIAVGNAGSYLLSLGEEGIGNLTGNQGLVDYAKKVREGINYTDNIVDNATKGIDKELDKYSWSGGKLDSVFESVGSSYAQAQLGGLLPGKGNIPVDIGKFHLEMPLTSVITGFSNSMKEAYEDGATNGQAIIKGITGGLVEGFTEGMFGVFGQGGSSIEDKILGTLTKNIGNTVARNIAKVGIQAAGEGAEEVASYILNWAFDNGQDLVYQSILGKDYAKMGKEFSLQELGENFLSGALAGGFSSGAETIGRNVRANSNKVNAKNINAKVAVESENMEHQIYNKGVASLTETQKEQLQGIVRNAIETNQELNVDDVIAELNANETIRQNLLNEEKARMLEEKRARISEKTGKEISLENVELNNKEIKQAEKNIDKMIEEGKVDIEKIESQLNTQEDRDAFNQLVEQYGYTDAIREAENFVKENQKAFDEGKLDDENQALFRQYKSELDARGKALGEQQELISRYKKNANMLKSNKYNPYIKSYIEDYENKKAIVYDLAQDTNDKVKKFHEQINEAQFAGKQTRELVDTMSKLIERSNVGINVKSVDQAIEDGEILERKLTKAEQTKVNELQEQLDNTKDELQKDIIQQQIDEIKYEKTNGFYKDGEITVLYTKDGVKNVGVIIGHELRHALESSKLNNEYNEILKEYAKTQNTYSEEQNDYDYLMERIKKAYKTQLESKTEEEQQQILDSEFSAIASSNYLFTDNDFLNQIATKPTLGDKIKQFFTRIAKMFSKTKYKGSLDEIRDNYIKMLDEVSKTGANVSENAQYSIIAANELKQQQFDLIKNNNPAPNDYQVWIRTPNDIKTWEEAMQNDESFVWGDFNYEDAEKALRDGEIRVYSSNNIRPGTFVSTSYNQALDYAGGDSNKVHSMVVPLEDVAWINGDEGQYAKVDNTQYSLDNNVEQMDINDITFQSEDYGKYIEEEDKGRIDIFKNILKNKADYYGFKYEDIAAPIVLRPEKVNGKYKMYDGQHRYIAYKQLGYDTVPVVFKDNQKQYSLDIDSNGNKLSPEQQTYFADSKVRDDEGKLMPMYHGTPNGEFTVFRPGSYFSSNKEYADGYQNTWASSISSNKVETTPKTYEVYLNITNPFSLQDTKAKDIYLNEYVKGGNSMYLDPYSDYTDYVNGLDELDWTEGEDFKEWLQENHPEYDGLILDEGGDGGYGNAEYRWRGKSYIPFNSNQIKNIDNTTPTDDPDIRYTLDNNLTPDTGLDLTRGETELRDYEKAELIQDFLNDYLGEETKTIDNVVDEIHQEYVIKRERLKKELRDLRNQLNQEEEIEEGYRPLTMEDVLTRDAELENYTPEYIPQEEDEFYYDTENTSPLDEQFIEKITKDYKKSWKLSKEQAQEFANDIREISSRPNLSRQDVADYINQNFSGEMVKQRNHDIAEVQSFLKDYPIGVSQRIKDEIASQYETFSNFRKNYYRKLKLTNDDGINKNVDQAYKELSEMYPYFFNEEEISNPTDQLLKIAEVADMDKYNSYFEPLPQDVVDAEIDELYSIMNDYRNEYNQYASENDRPGIEYYDTLSADLTPEDINQRIADIQNELETMKGEEKQRIAEARKEPEIVIKGKYDDRHDKYAKDWRKTTESIRKKVESFERVSNRIDYLTQDLSNFYEEYRSEEPTLFEEDLEEEIFKDYSQSKQDELTRLGERYDNLQKEIDELDKKRQDLEKYMDKNKEIKPHKEIRGRLLDEMGITVEDLNRAKNISTINLNRTDPVRVAEKIFGKEIGTKINEGTVNHVKKNEAERIRFLNKEREGIKELGIKARSAESAAVQKYGEGEYINNLGQLVKYGDNELAQEFSDKATQEKIKNAAKDLRARYKKYLNMINRSITNMGYDPIPERKDYFRHFNELNDKLSQWGIPFNLETMKSENLPTDINGITDQFKPGKQWFASALHREGVKTTYDAITGIDGYLEGATNLIFHTKDIQRYRALSEYIRNTYGTEKGFNDTENMTEEERQDRINKIQNNFLSSYAAWLDEQANALANKKGKIDRGVEELFGRRAYTALNTIKQQVGSNMTGFNVRSALTNFISTTLAAGRTNKTAMLKGTVDTINNMFHDDGFANKSDFLTSRFGSERLSNKLWQRIANTGQIFMNGTDKFTANLIVRSKYQEGLMKGMTEKQAMRYADDFAARVMGDRSKGATATIFNSKTLGVLTQFQLETNNQLDYLLHDSKMELEGLDQNAKSNAIKGMIWQMGQIFAYSYFYNELFEKLTGSRAAFDPIDIFKKLAGADDDDKDKTLEERSQEAIAELVDTLPFTSLLGKGGRMPISEAFEGTNLLYDYLTGETDAYGNKIKPEDVAKQFKEDLGYWLMPTGYGQVKKTKGAYDLYFDENGNLRETPGSYTDSGKLRFQADTDPTSVLENLIFGQWSSEQAQEYISGGFKSLTEKQQAQMVRYGMTKSEYLKYKEGMKGLTKKADKKAYIESLNYPEDIKQLMINDL